ncbi:hypothetical protein KP509_34G003300 [Ceratopteris richardii]|uniref:rRNA-processing protein FYV7 n=1 Tax=Ceratopteris richardii TaxID=49495 RepID=A0A8T2QJF3_CERRI|nr:hypothetical protein KP509_34G003300 [Ceratopteris richardii]
MKVFEGSKKKKMKDKKSRQRLGGIGGGLTLPAFVNAKSRPRFNPAEIRKRREQFEDAKKIRKYRKLLKSLPQQEQRNNMEESSDVEAKIPIQVVSNDNTIQQKNPSDLVKKERRVLTKRSNILEVLRKDYLKKKEEEDRLKAERMEALKLKEEQRVKAFQERKNLKSKMFKRTKSGQPLMKHRLQHVLECIQQSQ